MGKRIGRKRLYSLEKLGQTNDNTAGTGMADAIVSSKVSRDGAQITTEIVVDLASSSGALTSCSTDGFVIGISASSGTHLPAHLGRITEAVNGVITDAEVICTEVPATGEKDIDVIYESVATVAFSASAGTDKLVEAGTDYVKGLNKVGEINNNAAEGDYLYLACGSAHGVAGTAAQTYTTGKLVIRLYGYAVTGD
tara:strand:+ start:1625 stop:2212 length:588 start_codon:yes stop_codon:yes gene_type:complete